MRKIRIGSAMAIGFMATTALASNALAADLELRRVMLSAGGVGYFEHEATVTGDARLSLDVPLDQVSDVLKSIVVFDDQGRVGQATLPGRAPLDEVFRGLPFGQSDLSSPAALLRALRGAEVRITVGTDVLQGRVVSVTEEKVTLPQGAGTITRHRVALLGERGVQQVVVEEARSIEIVDETLRAEVARALAAVAAFGERAERTISIQIAGQGERQVRVGYVVRAPLWKATYRLVLPKTGNTAMATLQGWAVLENMSGHDWNGVQVAVSSGNPLTFRQALYEAFFVERPEIPVDLLSRFVPPIDPGSFFALESMGNGHGAVAMMAARSAVLAPADLMRPAALEGMTQVVFHFPNPITLPSGQSLLAPITHRQMPVTRVSLHRSESNSPHPLASLRIKNEVSDDAESLPPGALAIYEATEPGTPLMYVGDALLGALPKGEERIVSYAVDLAVRVDSEKKQSEVVQGATIVDGVLNVFRKALRSTMYTIAGAENEDRVVIVEHPRIEGYDVESPKDLLIGSTREAHRFRVEVPQGTTKLVTVVLSRLLERKFVLLDAPMDEIRTFIDTTAISEAVREQLVRVAELRQNVAAAERALARIAEERAEIAQDQARLRANLEVVSEGSDLHTRYLERLTMQENRLEELRAQREQMENTLRDAREALREYVRTLTVQ